MEPTAFDYRVDVEHDVNVVVFDLVSVYLGDDRNRVEYEGVPEMPFNVVLDELRHFAENVAAGGGPAC